MVRFVISSQVAPYRQGTPQVIRMEYQHQGDVRRFAEAAIPTDENTACEPTSVAIALEELAAQLRSTR